MERNDPALKTSLESLRLVRLSFTLRALETVRLGPDEMKGDKWRGWLGAALSSSGSGEMYRAFFGKEKQPPPRPYVLRPRLDSRRVYATGDSFSVDVVLMGSSAAGFRDVMAVFEEAGGIGVGGGQFEVAGAGYEHIDTKGMLGAEIEPTDLVIEMLTPLKMKIGKKLYYDETPFEVFMKLLIKRLVNLNNLYGGGSSADGSGIKQEIQALVGEAAHIRPRRYTDWTEFRRFSSKEEGWQKMGGQMGLISARGDLSLFYPYLKIGELVGIGSDTTRGFGRYRVFEIKPEERA